MTSTTIAGLLMMFSAAMGAHFAWLHRANFAHWMHGPVGSLAALLGTVCGFAGAFAFIRENGWGVGLLWWVGSGLGFAAVGFMGSGVFPLLLALGIVSGIAGLVLLFF